VAVWWPLRYPYTLAVAAPSAHVIASFAPGMRADEIIRAENGRIYLDTGLDRHGEPWRVPLDDAAVVTWNSVYLLWVAMLTPRRRLRRLWLWGVLATVALWLSQIAYFTFNIVVSVGGLYLERAPEDAFLSGGTLQVLDICRRTYSLTFSHLVPFVLWSPVLLVRLRESPVWEAPRGAPQPPRNTPCPCGSGRKFKRCCGAAAR